jgi:hypothetical protein
MVRISNGRDWHKIESEYQRRFGIRMPTVFKSSLVIKWSKTFNIRTNMSGYRMVASLDRFINKMVIKIIHILINKTV